MIYRNNKLEDNGMGEERTTIDELIDKLNKIKKLGLGDYYIGINMANGVYEYHAYKGRFSIDETNKTIEIPTGV